MTSRPLLPRKLKFHSPAFHLHPWGHMVDCKWPRLQSRFDASSLLRILGSHLPPSPLAPKKRLKCTGRPRDFCPPPWKMGELWHLWLPQLSKALKAQHSQPLIQVQFPGKPSTSRANWPNSGKVALCHLPEPPARGKCHHLGGKLPSQPVLCRHQWRRKPKLEEGRRVQDHRCHHPFRSDCSRLILVIKQSLVSGTTCKWFIEILNLTLELQRK